MGEFSDGKLHGRGKLVWPDGVIYEGEFKKGLKDGYGVQTLADGSAYQGNFSGGLEDGKGTITYTTDGSSSSYSWKAGDRYQGGWKAGKRHGDSEYTFWNGQVLKCKWSDDSCSKFLEKQSELMASSKMYIPEKSAIAAAGDNLVCMHSSHLYT